MNALGAPDYAENFDGYPHNFRNVVPNRLLEQHPAWGGILTNQEWASWVGADKLNRRLPPNQNNCTFDMTHPGLRQFVINKAIDVWNGHLPWYGPIYWLLPGDSSHVSVGILYFIVCYWLPIFALAIIGAFFGNKLKW